MMGKCPLTCCHGWMIPVTPADRDRFSKEKGLFRLRLLNAISYADIRCFNKGSGTCPFIDKEGLCSLQLKRGHDFIPEACRMYPRFYRNWGPFEEHYLDLSCIAASRLFLDNALSLKITESVGDALSEPCTTNDDIDLLRYLWDTRDRMVSSLMAVSDAAGLFKRINAIINHSSALQEMFLNGSEESGGFPVFDDDDTGDVDMFPLKGSTITRIMDTSFYNIRLKKANPILYDLCMLYYDRREAYFGKDDAWDKALNEHLLRDADTVRYYASYLAYYLYLYYLRSYEDYSFVKNISLGVIHLTMVMMFNVLLGKDKEGTDRDSLAKIISSYGRRAYFNSEISDEMYDCLRS